MNASSRHSRRLLVVALLAGTALLVVLSAAGVLAGPVEGAVTTSTSAIQLSPPSPNAPTLPVTFAAAHKAPAGLDSVLDQVERVYRVEGKDAALTFAVTRGLRLEGEGVRVLVEAEPGAEAAARAAIEANGGRLLSSYRGLFLASVSPDKLRRLLEGAGVRRVVPDLPPTYDGDASALDPSPLDPSPSSGPLPGPGAPMIVGGEIVSEGVAETNASAWHAAGYRGHGIKIGVIDFGFSGYSSLLGTELPSVVTAWGRSPAGSEGEGGDHGSKVAQVIHDMAPEADLFLARVDALTDFGLAKDWLLSQGVQVINFSGGWHCSGLLEGDGDANAIVTDAVDRGVFWAGSAGNFRKNHWMGDFTDPDGDGWLNWDGQEEVQVIWADKGKTISGYLTWKDSWNGASQDYDLYLYRWDGQSYIYETGCGNRQDGTGDAAGPVEWVSFKAPSSAAYAWFIRRYAASGTNVDFDFFSYHNAFDDGYSYSFFDYARSLGMPPGDNGSRGFMASAAIGRGPVFALEDYSSEGPTRDGRLAPEIASPSDVQVFFGTFNGTSAAAPHLAGAAALVLQAFPDYTPAQVEDYLRANAVDLGPSGPDNQFGYGRLHLPEPPTDQVDFPDVTEAHPYYTQINALAALGIVSGYGDGTFGPDNLVMRQQFAKMIVKALRLPVTGTEICPFRDVGGGMDPRDPFYPDKYVAVCAAQEITQGKTPTSFAPYDNITRQQLVTMVARAADLSDPPLDYFPSFLPSQFYPLEHYLFARKAAYAGILDGLEGMGPSYGFLSPATRGEVCALLYNFLRR